MERRKLSTILKRHDGERFTQIPNDSVRDKRLSLKATGLLSWLLSHEDGWDISSEAISRVKTDGVASIRAGYDELIEAGYVKREKFRDEHGHWRTEIHVWAVSGAKALVAPSAGFPTSEEPNVGRPDVGESVVIEKTKGEDKQETPSPAGFSEWWEMYPRKTAKRAAEKAYRAALKRGSREVILEGLQSQLAALKAKETKFIPYPATWLNEDRWADEEETVTLAAPIHSARPIYQAEAPKPSSFKPDFEALRIGKKVDDYLDDEL